MRKSFLFGLGMLAILLAACEKEYYEGPDDQPVFFEYHYINHAWGLTDHGWMIDSEGTMRGYTLPENYRWPDSTGYLTRDDLQYNLAQTDTLLRSFKGGEMERYTRLIGGAAEGNLSKSVSRGADMGSSSLSCYAFDPKTGSYKHVLLAVSGDWEQHNQSAEARELVKWLSDFDVAFLSD